MIDKVPKTWFEFVERGKEEKYLELNTPSCHKSRNNKNFSQLCMIMSKRFQFKLQKITNKIKTTKQQNTKYGLKSQHKTKRNKQKNTSQIFR